MLVKLDSVKQLNVHKRQNAKLFKKNNPKSNVVVYSGKNVMKDSHFSSFHNFLFGVLDKISPMANRHPRFGRVVMKLGEKILGKSKDLMNK